jgi:GT2 family glycosyltransferase
VRSTNSCSIESFVDEGTGVGIALVIPSIGSPHLAACLAAVEKLEPAPDMKVLVLTGGANSPSEARGFEVLQSSERFGFAAAVNTGLEGVPGEFEAAAVLNDDAIPEREWLGALATALESDPKLAAVQGTVLDSSGSRVDGRGIEFDRWGLPVQIDRGKTPSEKEIPRPPVAVSGTACLYRLEALRAAALPSSEVFDQSFDCYHEDLDLGLRLGRLGWHSKWISGAPARHLGSASGTSLSWRHPWWLLANRWRALAGNLSQRALVASLTRLLRGEARAVRTLLRTNRRSLPVSMAVTVSLPVILSSGWRRQTPGPRLEGIPRGAE